MRRRGLSTTGGKVIQRQTDLSEADAFEQANTRIEELLLEVGYDEQPIRRMTRPGENRFQ